MTSPDPLALAAVVAYCGWDPTLPVVDETVSLDGNGTALLTLPSLHVTDVSAVTVTDRWGSTKTLTVDPVAPPTVGDATPAGVTWSGNGVVLRRGCVWPSGQRNITITYSGGYDYPPDEITAVLNSIGRRTGGPTLGATSTRMGTAAVTFGQQIAQGGLLLVETMVLDRYRLPKVA